MTICKTKLGEDHPDTLRNMGNLACTHRSQGRWSEAGDDNFQGKYHSATLNIMGNPAITYLCSGRFPEAELLQIQMLIRQKTWLRETIQILFLA